MPAIIKKEVTLKSHLNPSKNPSSIYLVSIINDKRVSWEFCIRTLLAIFHKERGEAEKIAHEITTNGEGFCGGYTFEIAQTKANLVEEAAKREGFSILCLIEET